MYEIGIRHVSRTLINNIIVKPDYGKRQTLHKCLSKIKRYQMTAYELFSYGKNDNDKSIVLLKTPRHETDVSEQNAQMGIFFTFF